MTTDFARMMPLVAETALKGSAIFGLAAVAAQLLRRASAASRHLVWQYSVLAVLALSITSPLVKPRWAVMPRLWPGAVAPAPSTAQPAAQRTASLVDRTAAGPAESARQ